ncbi:MAG: epoxyqueuosine reductase QueH [Bacteroidales bacterium]|nr:epoxyqueuosine reductase QueH [Bacteroidales bacterium]
MNRILLHACCAPCSGAVVEWMVAEGLSPTLFFSNANIVPEEEYALRRSELLRYAERFGLEVVDDVWDHPAWLQAVSGLENEPERGARCLQCFRFRLFRAARYAAEHGFDTLATTLASSRWKSLEQVDEAGRDACAAVQGVQWWGKNWRKGGLQQRRGEIIREQGFYNQDYCGCEFSLRKSHEQHGDRA